MSKEHEPVIVTLATKLKLNKWNKCYLVIVQWKLEEMFWMLLAFIKYSDIVFSSDVFERLIMCLLGTVVSL